MGGGNDPLLGKFNQIGIKINFMEILFPVAEGEFFLFCTGGRERGERICGGRAQAEGSMAEESAAVTFSARLDALDKQQSAKKILILRRG